MTAFLLGPCYNLKKAELLKENDPEMAERSPVVSQRDSKPGNEEEEVPRSGKHLGGRNTEREPAARRAKWLFQISKEIVQSIRKLKAGRCPSLQNS